MTPAIESVCRHERGNWQRIADWLFNCLDLKPPLPGGLLSLYLCYHPVDSPCFSSPQRNRSLIEALWSVYRRELSWDGNDSGDLQFDLEVGKIPLSLRRRAEVVSSKSKYKATFAVTHTLAETELAFHWSATSTQASPGALALLRQWVMPSPPATEMVAALKFTAGRLGPHLERKQRGANGSEPVIYLPHARTSSVVGGVGCDLNVPQLVAPFVVTYDADADEWSWRGLAGVQQGELSLDLPDGNGGTAVTLTGWRLPAPQTLDALASENQLPRYALEIAGCLLPLPLGAGGYGIVPRGLPLRARAGVSLPGDEGWIYLAEQNDEVYLLLRDGAPPGQPLQPRQRTRLGEWCDSVGLPPGFCGELTLASALSAELARGRFAEDIPDGLFPLYRDSSHGRAPVQLATSDGRQHHLIFHATAKHPVFVSPGRGGLWQGYAPELQTTPPIKIELAADTEFVLGTTHYRLRRLTEPTADNDSTLAQTAMRGTA